MTLLRRSIVVAMLAAVVGGCASADVVGPCLPGEICVNGTARFFTLEGGFWAVRGDDSVTYDPIDGLPAEFREAGLRVYLRARKRTDVGSFHMVGPIVDVISIRRLDQAAPPPDERR